MTFLKVHQVSVQGNEGYILKGISFNQKRLQRIAIAGETGSGKSTLLKVINGASEKFEGEVWFEGEKVRGMTCKLVPGHTGIAFLSQFFELQKSLTVIQVLSYANQLSEARAKKLYKICQIEHLLDRRTDQLSGGEKQRVALARLLSTSPELLLLDEPYSNLDTIHKQQLKQVIESVCEQLEITCIMVSHEPTDTLSWAEHILVMHQGEVVQQGKPEEIYHHPVNEYVAGLFGAYQLLDSSVFNFPTSRKSAGKRILLRSEYLKLEAWSASHVAAHIHQIKFYGAYKEAVVKVGDFLLNVRLTSDSQKVGDKVSIAWAGKHESWLL